MDVPSPSPMNFQRATAEAMFLNFLTQSAVEVGTMFGGWKHHGLQAQ